MTTGDFEREISRAIGAIEASIKNIELRATEDRKLQNKRHDDNQAAIERLESTENDTKNAVATLTKELRQQALTVSGMQPQISSLQVSRTRLATLASLGLLTLWFVGRALEYGAQWLIEHLFKIKFGG